MKDNKRSVLSWLVLILLVVGGLNWGLVGIANLDLVARIFGSIPVLQKIIYILVGLAAVVKVYRVATR